MALAQISSEELRKARKNGFKRKRPKKPKKSAGVGVLENFIVRHNEWVKDAKAAKAKVNEKNKAKEKKAALKKQIFGY